MANEIKPITSTDISAMGAVVGNLMTDLRQIIDEARIHVASTANYELTMMYWHIGERINRVVLGNERATYGKQIVPQVATQFMESRLSRQCHDNYRTSTVTNGKKGG